MDPLLMRGIERLLTVVIAGFSIFLGYRLLLAIPERSDSEGKLDLPGGISIYVSRVGPGTILGAFGILVLLLSLYTPIYYGRDGDEFFYGLSPAASSELPAVESVPAHESAQTAAQRTEQITERRIGVRVELEFLNQLEGRLDPDLSPEERRDVRIHVEAIKLRLIESIWDDGWGSPSDLRAWIETGRAQAPPGALRGAIELYAAGAPEP